MKNEKRQAKQTKFLRRFWRDESGQGIVFAAASMILMVGFVALVFNVGTVVENRMRIQMAADNAVYSGAMVQANSLSTIAWINSAMAQIYYNCQRYAVDVNVTGVAAVAELRLTQGAPGGEACAAHRRAWERAETYLPEAKNWLVDLTRMENAIAILTPRLVEEEMFSVGMQSGVERLSLYPSNRMFPHEGDTLSYRIERFDKGWRITTPPGSLTGNMLKVQLKENDEWHIEYSNNDVTTQKIIIHQESSTWWTIRYYDGSNNLKQAISIRRTENLGWVVWGSDTGGQSLPTIEFEPVDMDGDDEGIKEGTRITYKGTSQVIRRGEENDLYLWNYQSETYQNMTSSTTNIAGVKVNVNVSNIIEFPGGSARIGDPTVVTIGRATIVLHDPPTIRAGLGPVTISIRGFDPDSFTLSVGGFSLTRGDADGRWRKYFNRQEELWWRHRLVEQRPEEAGAIQQWQYDRQVLGAYMQYEAPDSERYIDHVYGDRHGADYIPHVPWLQWFDKAKAEPFRTNFRHILPDPANPLAPCDYDAPDSRGIRKLTNGKEPPDGVYCLTVQCANCNGAGYVPQLDAQGNPVLDAEGNPVKVICPSCLACDNGGSSNTDVRVFLMDLLAPHTQPLALNQFHTWILQNPQIALITDNKIDGLSEDDYLDARIYRGGYGLPTPYAPLVLAEEFFAYGVNAGAWRDADTPMLFRYVGNTRQRVRDGADVPGWSWGYIGISSARVGIPDAGVAGGFREHFENKEDRADWCANHPNNLYAANVHARLYPSREQVKGYDLDREILQGETGHFNEDDEFIPTPIDESGTSYLWDAVLRSRGSYPYESGGWLSEYDGRSDPRVNELLRTMQTRAEGSITYGTIINEDIFDADIFYFDGRGTNFDFGSAEIDEVVLH